MKDDLIKVKPWGKGQGDYVVVHKDDFNPEFHVKLNEPEQRKPGRPRKDADN